MELMLPKGCRDFLPEQKLLREEVAEKVKKVFERYGFVPLETPAIERLEVLSAKFAAGSESEIQKEIFKFKDQGKRDLGLKFDQTVPLARVIGMNPSLKMPFKRYQIDRAWRDGPIESNRYREFWQCDADIVGVKSVIADAEVLAVLQDCFKALDLQVEILINDRKLLFDLMDYFKIPKQLQESVLVSIDKLDKLPKKEVEKELKQKGLGEKQLKELFEVLELQGSNEIVLEKLEKKIGKTEGIKELKELLGYCKAFGVNARLKPSMVRGLAYYTGPIFEAWSKEALIKGSLAGGGRWDEMIGKFLGSEKEFPATGFALGFERICDAIEKKQKEGRKTKVELYIISVGVGLEKIIEITQKARSAGVNADFDFLQRGISKSLDYCNKLGIPFAAIIGENELKENCITLRNMKSGEQKKLKLAELGKLRELF